MVKSVLLLYCIFFHTALFAQTYAKIAPGIWKVSFGEPEAFPPSEFKELPSLDGIKQLSDSNQPPFDLSNIKFKATQRGCIAELNLDDEEELYGFGLQANTFKQKGLRKEIHVNSLVTGNIGFSHAPVPFYLSTRGYGVLVNTSRYVKFYPGTMHETIESIKLKESGKSATGNAQIGQSVTDLYKALEKLSNTMIIEIPAERGMELYIFEGPTMKESIQRYNLYSGGGCIPPLWGLGVKYRGKGDNNDERSIKLAKYFRENNIPCDMFGLEPGWQTVAYSCSFEWSPERFTNPDNFIARMDSMNYKLNLWEHAYTFPSSPLFDPLKDKCGDYIVWKGLVPDFADPEARDIFGNYHEENFVKKGIAAFKLDECDAADYKDAAAQWSFPEFAEFPSGLDGEQMHQLFGILYQKTMLNPFNKNNKRTYLEVRSSHAFASPYSATLYSDMYDHADFVRMIPNSGFSGLLWSPEIRETNSDIDLIRRVQTGVMSAQLNFNSWYLNNPPWLQYNRDKNNSNEFLPNAKEIESIIRELLELRMSLIPYLYAAFSKYHFEGVPPFRALIVDYPNDLSTRSIDDEYLIGDNLLAAPFIDGASKREVYFPEGNWYDFNSGKKFEGNKTYNIEMSLDEIPLFVKEGAILPLAKPVQFITLNTVFDIICHVYGSKCQPTSLFEDNSYNNDFAKGTFNTITLNWDGKKGKVSKKGNYKGSNYRIVDWVKH